MSIYAYRTLGEGRFDPQGWRLTQEEADAVKTQNLSVLADPADGILDMGACMDASTHRPCEHASECMSRAIARQPIACYVREAANDEAARAAKRKMQMLEQAADVLAYMRDAGAPVTLKQVAGALGYAETPLLLRGAWNHLLASNKITACGKSYQRGYRHTHYVKTWIITEAIA